MNSILRSGQCNGPGAARRRLSTRLAVGVFASMAMLASGAARAGVQLTGIEGVGEIVADRDLAEMRGKFINARGISFFGMQLQTSWQGSDGITTRATVLFNVDFARGINADGATPRLLIGWSRDCVGCADSGMDVAGFGPAAEGSYVAVMDSSAGLPINGLATVQGAVQSQHINGSDNAVRNTMMVAIGPGGSSLTGVPAGMSEVTASSRQSFADGDSIRFILEPGNLALALTDGNGTDSVRQGMGGDANQLAQHVLLESSFNRIDNIVGITVGMSDLRQAGRMNVSGALAMMKGRGF